MVFPFPFRGVAYKMSVTEGQNGVAGDVVFQADKAVDEATGRVAVTNACSFIGRFPNSAAQGVTQAGGSSWTFAQSCL